MKAELISMARKPLAQCQKQPWQQPCNLIVSHVETLGSYFTFSWTDGGQKQPRLRSWKNKVRRAQRTSGHSTFKHIIVCSYTMFKYYSDQNIKKKIPLSYTNISETARKWLFILKKLRQWTLGAFPFSCIGNKVFKLTLHESTAVLCIKST